MCMLQTFSGIWIPNPVRNTQLHAPVSGTEGSWCPAFQDRDSISSQQTFSGATVDPAGSSGAQVPASTDSTLVYRCEKSLLSIVEGHLLLHNLISLVSPETSWRHLILLSRQTMKARRFHSSKPRKARHLGHSSPPRSNHLGGV